MTHYLFLLFSLLVNSIPALGTIFVPQPLSEQIKDASSVIQGKYLEQSTRALSSGSFITESTFQLTKALEGEHQGAVIKVLTPGGQLGNKVQMIDGTPIFKKNEEVVLLLKKSPEGYWVHNLALGKYLLIESQGKQFLHSEIFAHNPLLAKFPYEKFEQLITEHFKRKFVSSNLSATLLESASPQLGRSTSDTKIEEKNLNSKSKLDFKLLALIFLISSLSFGLYRWKTSLRE